MPGKLVKPIGRIKMKVPAWERPKGRKTLHTRGRESGSGENPTFTLFKPRPRGQDYFDRKPAVFHHLQVADAAKMPQVSMPVVK